MKADLHCHSFLSDGQHDLDFLVTQASQNQITHLAITDHDCVDVHFLKHANDDLSVIPGVEISCSWKSHEVHVVGLFVDPTNKQLQDLLKIQQQKRFTRIQRIDHRLNRIDIHGLTTYVRQLPCVAVSRSHAADFLVKQSVCKNRQQAFKRFLGKQGRAWVAGDWCSLTEAINSIRGADGIAVLAHPLRYKLSRGGIETLVAEFIEAGGESIEASYPNLNNKEKQYLETLCQRFSLHASVGSDFHSQEAHWTSIGKFPELGEKAKKNAIWEHPRWHSFSKLLTAD